VLDAIVSGLAAMLVLRWLAARDPSLPGILYALELVPQLALTAHTVYRVPRCPTCFETGHAGTPMPWASETLTA